MPRKKAEPKKTPARKTSEKKTPVRKNRRAPVKTVKKNEKKKEEFTPYVLPNNLKFRRKGITYKEGDLVEVVTSDGITYAGVLKNILSSQLYIKSDECENGKMFFQSGINIKKMKAKK